MLSTSSTAFSRLPLAIGVLVFALGGCATTARPPLPSVPELTAVPFFPQTDYDCGPAALATILNAADVAVTPEELIERVYIAELRGSLQPELLAATRRFGLLPVPVAPTLESLLAEVAGGRPVLVLQNLGFARAPVWHYAVVVGYDAERDRVVLRSGTDERRLERLPRFLRSWRLAGHWGFVAAQPGETPAGATPDRYMRALLGAQESLGDEQITAGYGAALSRWPEEPLVVFFAAARAHAAADLDYAVALYRRVLAHEPDHGAARNNLADALLQRGCRTAALREARAALSRESPDSAFYSAIADTVRQIESTPDAGREPAYCAAD